MPGLKEVLADKTQYPDNLVWNMGNGATVTLGQLRSVDSDRQNEIIKADTKLKSDQAAFESKVSEFRNQQTNLADLYTKMQSAVEALRAGRINDPAVNAFFGQAGIPAAGNDPFAALSRLEQDNLLGPIVQVMKAVNKQAEKAIADTAALQEVNKRMATNYLNGVLEDRYDRLVPLEKQEKYPLASLIQEAVRSNLMASDSTPNIKEAFKRLSAGETEAAKLADAVKAEHKKLADSFGISVEQLEARLKGEPAPSGEIFVPTPASGGFGLDVHNRTGKAPQAFKSLDDAFAAASKDKDIWSNVDSILQ